MDIMDLIKDANYDMKDKDLLDLLQNQFPYKEMTNAIEKRLDQPLCALKAAICDKLYQEISDILGANKGVSVGEYDPSKIDISENPSLIKDFEEHLCMLYMINRALKGMDND